MGGMANELIVHSYNVNGVEMKEFPHPSGFRLAALINNIEPEMVAAIGANLSRNPGSLRSRLGDMSPERKERIIGGSFKTYGHNSIGDMAHTQLISVEGVSMVAAMNSILFPKFDGQEASTRYINFGNAEYILPEKLRQGLRYDEYAQFIIRTWFDLYKDVTEYMTWYFKEQGVSEKEIVPMVCDITGAFLPIATKTTTAICCDARSIIDHAWEMQTYGGEIKLIGEHLLAVVDHLCPNAVDFDNAPDGIEFRSLIRDMMDREMLATAPFSGAAKKGRPRMSLENLSGEKLLRFLRDQPPHILANVFDAEEIGRYGSVTGSAQISFRSLRDMFRHRPHTKLWSPRTMVGADMVNEEASAGLLNFAPWYLDQLPDRLRERVVKKMDPLLTRGSGEINKYIRNRHLNPIEQTYLVPMGVQTPFEMTGNLDKMFYMIRQRSGPKVHTEVRDIICSWARQMFGPDGLDINPETIGLKYVDMEGTDYEKRSADA